MTQPTPQEKAKAQRIAELQRQIAVAGPAMNAAYAAREAAWVNNDPNLAKLEQASSLAHQHYAELMGDLRNLQES